MFSDRWKLLKEMMDGCCFTTPDRKISHPQFLQLFHAFLLQVKENHGIVYILQSGKNEALASHFANTIMTSLNIAARHLMPFHQDVMLSLALLIKKTDLIIILGSLEFSSELLEVVNIAKGKDIPLITLSGGEVHHPLKKQGDLNIHFNTQDENLMKTGQFSFFKMIVNTWIFESERPFAKKKFFLTHTNPQILSREFLR